MNSNKSLLVFPFFASLLRPVLLVMLLRDVKSFWKRIIKVNVEALPMTLFILVYIMFFAWVGQQIFTGTVEGV